MIDFRTPERRTLRDRRMTADRRVSDRRKTDDWGSEHKPSAFVLENDNTQIRIEGETTES